MQWFCGYKFILLEQEAKSQSLFRDACKRSSFIITLYILHYICCSCCVEVIANLKSKIPMKLAKKQIYIYINNGNSGKKNWKCMHMRCSAIQKDSVLSKKNEMKQSLLQSFDSHFEFGFKFALYNHKHANMQTSYTVKRIVSNGKQITKRHNREVQQVQQTNKNKYCLEIALFLSRSETHMHILYSIIYRQKEVNKVFDACFFLFFFQFDCIGGCCWLLFCHFLLLNLCWFQLFVVFYASI